MLDLILTSVIGGVADPMVGMLTGIGLSLLMPVGVPVAAVVLAERPGRGGGGRTLV